MTILVFDMGGTSVKYGEWINEKLHNKGSFMTPDSWNTMKECMWKVYNEANKNNNLKGIAISSPGSVDIDKGVIGGISAIPYIHHFKIVDELETMFNLPVSIENDANCAALAEIWQGSAKDYFDVLFVVIGTGIGGAVIIDKEIQRGHNLLGGEFGIMLLDGKNSFSELGTAVHMAERYCRTKKLSNDAISGEEVFNLAKNGDEVAIKEVNNFYDYLALGLYNLQFTTDPSAIVLGGGVSQHQDLIPELNERLDKMLKDKKLDSITINLKPCHFMNDANLIGAIAAFNNQKGVTFDVCSQC